MHKYYMQWLYRTLFWAICKIYKVMKTMLYVFMKVSYNLKWIIKTPKFYIFIVLFCSFILLFLWQEQLKVLALCCNQLS